MQRFSSFAVGVALGVQGLVVLHVQSSYAQETAAVAQSLFEQGRDLFRAGHADQACPKLQESHRLEPATGTLLALAMCHEAQGKLASAWAEYSEVAIRAARQGQASRESHARAKVAELKPRLSSLEVGIPAVVATYPGLEVLRNGVALGEAAWNTPVPVDGGTYELEVRAPQRETWRQRASVGTERDTVVVAVPELAAKTPPTIAATAAVAVSTAPESGNVGSQRAASTELPRESPTESTAELSVAESGNPALARTGLILGGAGVAAWLVGGGFFYAAYEQKTKYQAPCEGETCAETADEHYEKARYYGNWATGLGIGGGALVVSGALLYWLHADTDPSADAARLHVDVGPGRAVIGVTGAF